MAVRFKSLTTSLLLLTFIACVASLSTWIWGFGGKPMALVPTSFKDLLRGGDGKSQPAPTPGGKPNKPKPHHPIDTLLQSARKEFHTLMAKETSDLESAAKAYRSRRGRHPPPGFDKWFEFARQRDAIIVEDFFDQIYHDLGPFWGASADSMRRSAKHFTFVVSVRDGKTSQRSDGKDRPWMGLWESLVAAITEHAALPDLDMAINIMDEPRVVVPWEEMATFMEKERKTREMLPAAEVISSFGDLKAFDENPGEPIDGNFEGHAPFWELAKVGCPPDSPFRTTPFTDNFTGPPVMPTGFSPESFHGYVANWTLSKDPCTQPEIQSSHGTFIEPLSKSTTHALFPMFGGSKLPMNNEILIPPAMYWSSNDFYTGGDTHGGPWEEKKSVLIWRGAATGGRNRPETWTRFQRHRFVNMVNGSAVTIAETTGSAPNFQLPQPPPQHMVGDPKHLGPWLSSFADAGFYDLFCLERPAPPEDGSTCGYSSPFFQIIGQMVMKDQYAYKFLPDIDGNSFSGRYWAFLWSTSLPIKATVYNEWHDSRLIPWLHFVPMGNAFGDLYGILEYFAGRGDCAERDENGKVKEGQADLKKGDGECIPAHDKEAKDIAMQGKEWAEKVLRKEDMLIYVYRLLLEYARLCDDRREKMGFVGDLLESARRH